MGDPSPAHAEIVPTIVTSSLATDTGCSLAAAISSCHNDGSGPSTGGHSPHGSVIDIPFELLIVIFQAFLPSIDVMSPFGGGVCESYVKGLFLLRCVSRSWRDLIDDTPSFWVVLTSTVSCHFNQTTITRSGDTPLIVHVGRPPIPVIATSSDLDAGRASLERFAEFVGPTRDRWKVVWVEEIPPPTVWACLNSPAPMLQTIRLQIASEGMPATFDLLGGETHHIRRLYLNQVRFPLTQYMFCGLKYLCLGNWDQEVTTDLILNFLAKSPDLEVLRLSSPRIPASATSLLHQISLPQLRSIQLDGFKWTVVTQLLRHIDAPHWQKITVKTGGTAEDYGPLDEAIEPLESRIREIHKKAGGSALWVSSFRAEWVNHGEHTFRFQASTNSASFLLMLRWIERIVGVADEEGLRLNLHFYEENIPVLQDLEVGAVLRGLGILTEINAVYQEDGSALVRFLCDGQDSSSTPVFPSLKVLRIAWGKAKPEKILQIVRSRFVAQGDGHKFPDLEIVAETPTIIQSMSIESLEFAVITQIRSTPQVTFRFGTAKSPRLPDGVLAIVWDEEQGVPAWMS